MDLGTLEQSVQLLLAVVALMLIGSSIDTLVCLYLSHSINLRCNVPKTFHKCLLIPLHVVFDFSIPRKKLCLKKNFLQK